MRYECGMSTLIPDFKADCKAAGVSPATVLAEAGIHKSLWYKWQAGTVSPTLRSFEAARKKLTEMAAERAEQDQAA